jgi:hypothetical protein
MKDQISIANLCKDCQVLALKEYPHGCSEEALRSYERYYQDDDSRSLELDYELRDSLPDFPVLSQSSKSGCDFCRFLRDILISKDLLMDEIAQNFFSSPGSRDVFIKMFYIWTEAALSEEGFVALRVELIRRDERGDEKDLLCVMFGIDCLDGMSAVFTYY